VYSGSWLSVPAKNKKILKATRRRMTDVVSLMVGAYQTFDNEAAAALLDSRSAIADLLPAGSTSLLFCGGGGPGEQSCFVMRAITDPSAAPFVSGDESVTDFLLKTNQNLLIISWSRSFGGSAKIVSPWLSLDTKCVSAVLRHPGCSSSCSMLVHMAVSGFTSRIHFCSYCKTA
jgi:hypothetical protein